MLASPRPSSSASPKVLIVTGGLLAADDRSLTHALKRQLASFRASSGGWLDLQMKLKVGRNLLAQRRYMGRKAFQSAPYRDTVERFFAREWNFGTVELTEVALMTLLAAEGLSYEATTYAALHADRGLRERLLRECEVVFASTTLLRDLSELEPLVGLLKRPGNRVILGGALASVIHGDFEGIEGVDVLAVGYGEMLVPALAAWIRSGYRTLEAPGTGRVVERGGARILYSGVPSSMDLDFLPTPDWTLAEAYHGRRFQMVHYESVRGCPYRCAFCNYPYLFDDTKFRYKSATKIADDWERYAAEGAEYVTCLDSLFTMPKRRLIALCEELIERGIRLKWICYARADDLCDIEVCRLMKRAGCHQVQIGIESGNQAQLDHMAKRCTVDKGRRALANCAETGLTTLVSLIVGFPGETQRSLADTLDFLRETKPDFAYVSPFMTRIEYVPILNPANRERFGIETSGGVQSSAPYWRHDTMCSSEVGDWWQWFVRQMTSERLALDGGLFYTGILEYQRADREALLDFQRDFMAEATRKNGLGQLLSPNAWLGVLDRWVQGRLEADVTRQLGARRGRHAA